jgi:hypothetical protein
MVNFPRANAEEKKPVDVFQDVPKIPSFKTQKPEAKPEEKSDVKGNAKFGEELENCGVATKCSPDEIAMQLYTGRENKDPPKICIDGK